MKQHRYRITVEHVADKDGQPPGESAALVFEAGNHDELLGVVEKIRSRQWFDPDTSAQLALGLKLLGEVMLMNRQHPLFSELGPQFGDFMKKLKGGAVQ